MTAVLKHELKSYFHSLTAYVFGAFLLAFVGIGSMLYNIQAAVSNFEFVLSFGSMIFVVIVPILTMRVIAEERKQKTDQLLYALPITTTQVILGKYLALLAVYLASLCIVALYPILFAQFGDVYMLTAYGSILAFFVMGAALIALSLGLTAENDMSEDTVTALLTTSSLAYSKVAGYSLDTYERESGDIDGPFALAVSVEANYGGRIVWFTSSNFLDEMYNAYSSGANADMAMNALSSLIGETEAMAIRSKSLNYNYLTISDSTASLLKVTMTGVFPLLYLGFGIYIVLRRRRLQNEPV